MLVGPGTCSLVGLGYTDSIWQGVVVVVAVVVAARCCCKSLLQELVAGACSCWVESKREGR